MGSRLEANSNSVRKKIEKHTFDDEEGEEYEGSKFGGFPEYFRRKKIKLQNLDAERRSQNADKPQIFKGVVAHVNGYTQPSLNDLHNMIVDYGGGFLQYLDGKTMVTHVIASNLTPKKKIEFRRYRMVKPAWVVDSIKAGRLLPWERYRVVDGGTRQNVLGFQGGSLTSQANTQQKGYREQTDASWYTSQVKEVASQLDGTEKTILPDSVEDVGMLDSADGVSPVVPDSNSSNGSTSRIQVPAVDDKPANGDTPADLDDEVMGEQEPEESIFVDDTEPLTSNDQHPAEPSSKDTSSPHQTIQQPADTSPTKKKPMTAEEHNAVLLADPKMWKSTVVNPAFLKQYYEESRLHHLSTWKAELKSELQGLAQEKLLAGSKKRPPGSRRYILHVDFDCFFASVSLKDHPEWMDKPVAVAHGSGAGSEIASCNYPARKFGIKNGMWMKGALEMYPDLKVLPYNFKAYEATSRAFYGAILETGGIVQSVSIDEALVDVSLACIEAGGSNGRDVSEESMHREQAKADEIAQQIRNDVRQRTDCDVSVGIGANTLLAKVALRKAKPAGQHQIRPEEVLDFIGSLAVTDLPGVAHSIGGKLEDLGIKLIKDIRETTKERLTTVLGPKTGEKIWDYARGIDRTEVGVQEIRKSVSAEVNWGVRFATQDQADEFVRSLAEELARRLTSERAKGRLLTMKLMRRAADTPLDPPKHLGHGKVDTFNKSMPLNVATNDPVVLGLNAVSLLKGFGFLPGELRGIGLQVTKLEPIKPIANPLFDSSQRRLEFKKPATRPKSPMEEDPNDTIETPKKAVKFSNPPPALASENPAGGPQSLLNTLGTQFLLPSQIDPTVLAELPEDIQKQLVPKTSKIDARQPMLNFNQQPTTRTSTHSAPQSPPPQADRVLSQSQLDPETLAELPEDIRSEVLAYYQNPPKQAAQRAPPQPQTPRKDKAKIYPMKKATPTKKRGGLLSRGRGRGKPQAGPSLTQSNFITRTGGSGGNLADTEISAEFLAALPDEIRREVLEQQRRERLKKRGGLDLAKKRGQPPPAVIQFRLELPPRPPRPTFTAKKVSKLPELRKLISAWVKDFDDEEPNEDDVEALASYLKKVVIEELDMAKAVDVVKWLMWVVDQDDKLGPLWTKALEQVKEGVQSAIMKRGLGKVTF